MKKIVKFDSGLRLAINTLKSTRSVAIGVYVGAGSAYETAENNGISHFIEHMLFKGTKKRNAFQIAEEMESVGAQINAFTSRELTSYYTLSTDEHIEKCMEVLSDIFFNSTFTKENIKKEQGVVLEEINMCEDDASDLCHDLLSLAYFGDSGLGRNILGSSQNVKSFNKEKIHTYIKEHYTPDNVVISVAGNVDYDNIYELCQKYFEKNFTKREKKPRARHSAVKESQFLYKNKPNEQANLAFAFPSFKYDSGKSLSVSLLSSILGGGMSSRLFQKLREELSLVYDIYATQSEYLDDGFFIVYLATNPSSVDKAVQAVKEVLVELKEKGITEKEFNKGREQLKSAIVLGAERSVAIMRIAGSRATLVNKTFDLNERLKNINKLTVDDINQTIKEIFDFDKVSASYVGKEIDTDILELFKK